MILTNNAVGGTALTMGKDINYDKENNETPGICERVCSLTGTYDYIVVQGGFNDIFKICDTVSRYGEIHDGYDVETMEDLRACINVENRIVTLAESLEAMCLYLTTEHCDAKKLFVLGHRKLNVKTLDTNGNEITLQYDTAQKYVWNLIVSILKKWGIPYVNLREETSLAAWNDTIANRWFSGGDGTHPNREGYEKFYVPLIEEKLKSL